jgi:hypothetical protein
MHTDDPFAKLAGCPVQAGQRWRHYKGSVYVVLHVGLMEADQTPAVVYRREDGVGVWVRPVDSWVDWAWDGERWVVRFVREEVDAELRASLGTAFARAEREPKVEIEGTTVAERPKE